MRDRMWGSYATRHYHLRWLIPIQCEVFDPDSLNGWVFAWRKLTPANLMRAMRERTNWQWLCRFTRGVNGRCYCPTGWQFRWFVQIAGFGFLLWVSHYSGPDPCPCDEISDELSELSALNSTSE